MHTLRKSKKEGEWCVGFLSPQFDHVTPQFKPMFDQLGFANAVGLVNYLNGGGSGAVPFNPQVMEMCAV
jgi:hypothetical protein